VIGSVSANAWGNNCFCPDVLVLKELCSFFKHCAEMSKRGRGEAESASADIFLTKMLLRAAEEGRWKDVIETLKAVSVAPQVLRQLNILMHAALARMNADFASARSAFLKSLDE